MEAHRIETHVPATSALVLEPAAPRARPGHYVLAVLLALAGGVLGIFGAFFGELRAGLSPLIIFVGAPVIEEIVKPMGIYILVARWPYVITRQPGIALLAALSGLTFGLLESLIYVTLYVPDHPDWFPVFRFTVPVAMHTLASFIAGLGITVALIGWAYGKNRLPRASVIAFAAAILLHAVYNITAVSLEVAGVFDFEE
jgi:RsiW-degrading membrane proteinase PrsW (M82 family)